MKTTLTVAAALAGSLIVTGCNDDNDDLDILQPVANVRVLHASPDAPAVEVAIDGEVVLSAVEFQQGSGYLEVPAGIRDISILAGGNVVVSERFTVGENEYFSIIARNEVASLDLVALDDTQRRANGSADVTVVHAAPGAGSVDVNVTAAGAPLPGTPTLDDVAFGATATLENQPAGDYQVRISGAADPEIVYDSGTLPVSADVTAVAVDSIKGVAPVTLLVWAEADPAVTAVLDNSAEVRVVHAVDSVVVDVFVDGQAVATDFSYTTASDYLVLPAGERNVAVAAAGQGLGNAIPTLTDALTVERGESYTVVAAGDVNRLGDSQLIVLQDRRVADDAARADVRLVHAAAAPAAQPVDIFVLAAGEPVMGEPTFADVLFGADTGYTTLPAASYDIVIAADGTTTAAVPGTNNLGLAAGSVTTAIAIGAGVNTLAALLLDDLRPVN